MEIIKMNHDAGFFSVCNINLRTVIGYYTDKKQFCLMDTESQWNHYKDYSENVYEKFFSFKENEFDIEIKKFSESTDEDQFSDYGLINYDFVSPFVEKYFSPNSEVLSIKDFLMDKYNLELSNTICVCYRGNDKMKETNLPTYQDMELKLYDVLSKNPNHKVLIQSDEKEFCEYFKEKNNNFIVIDEIDKISSTPYNAIQYTIPQGNKIKNAQTFLAIMMIMSKSDILITNSGNVGMWICLYRGNNKNVHQFLSPKGTTEKYWISN